jgi:hypothetical protein
VAERTNALALKARGCKSPGGSNPFRSARRVGFGQLSFFIPQRLLGGGGKF